MADISAFDNFFDNFTKKLGFAEEKKAQNTVKKAHGVKKAQNGEKG